MANDTSNLPPVPDGYKRCSKCKSQLPFTSFPKNKSKKDGYGTECHQCNRDRVKQYRIDNPDKVKETKKDWERNNPDKVRAIKRRWVLNNLDKVREIGRNNYAKNADKMRERARQKYASLTEMQKKAVLADSTRRVKIRRLSDPDRTRRENKEYYTKHSGKIKQRARDYAENHREEKRIYHQDWRRANPHKVTLLKHNRRTRERNLPKLWREADVQKALDYWGQRCCICGRICSEPYRLVFDHWIPISDPRPDNPGTVPWNLLPLCHSLKGGRRGCNNKKHAIEPITWLVEQLGDDLAHQKYAEIMAYFDWVRLQSE